MGTSGTVAVGRPRQPQVLTYGARTAVSVPGSGSEPGSTAGSSDANETKKNGPICTFSGPICTSLV